MWGYRTLAAITALYAVASPACDCGGTEGMAVDADLLAPDSLPTECSDASECEPLYGSAPCGAWECNASGQCEVVCPDCDDNDLDGYGIDLMPGGCAGPDCDDDDDTFFDNGTRTCYAGATGTDGVGTCRAGTETCTNGVLGLCTGEVLPSGEACNAQDDDCNGTDDDGLGMITCGIGACVATANACAAGVLGTCTPSNPAADDSNCNMIDDDCDGPVDEDCGCWHVDAVTGDDSMAPTNVLIPFATIQAAIDHAAATPAGPQNVCVAAGPACGNNRTYNEAIVMADGVSVLGGYERTTWTRCTTTSIATGVAEGVLFDASISSTTVLDGVRVVRATTSTSSAVTADGATNVVLSDLVIDANPVVTNSYGINLINGAEATILRSSIYGGQGTAETYGVRSIGSRPTIRENCQTIDPVDGHCNDFCGNTNLSIRGRFTQGTGSTAAVLLVDSPGATIEQTAMCGNDAEYGAGIKIEGDATGTLVRANVINAWGGLNDSHAIWMEDCGGAAPWILDNEYIAAAGDNTGTRVDGIRAVGDCHPVIDSNDYITGGGEGGATGANGVYCGAANGTASQCVVLGNARIQGSEFGFPPTAVGVRCDDDGCARIANNLIDGRGGVDSWGIYMGESSTVVENNVIVGGCPSQTATGVYAENSSARFANNLISGGACANGNTATYIGFEVVTGAGPNEIDVHSNTIHGGGQPAGACTSTGLSLGVDLAPPLGAVGVYRNNIVIGGECGGSAVVDETAVEADPRLFESNNLEPYGSPRALYVDEVSTGLTLAADVDALTDTTASGTLSVDSMFVNFQAGDLHLTMQSQCIDQGTLTGAPATDYDGEVRDSAPDIGADEYVP